MYQVSLGHHPHFDSDREVYHLDLFHLWARSIILDSGSALLPTTLKNLARLPLASASHFKKREKDVEQDHQPLRRCLCESPLRPGQRAPPVLYFSDSKTHVDSAPVNGSPGPAVPLSTDRLHATLPSSSCLVPPQLLSASLSLSPLPVLAWLPCDLAPTAPGLQCVTWAALPPCLWEPPGSGQLRFSSPTQHCLGTP